MKSIKMRSPKQANGQADWYRYYAGYSRHFVQDAVNAFRPEFCNAPRILDPWNGSGTTTSTARSLDLDAHGFDLNPAAVVIAKARLLDSGVRESLYSLSEELLEHAQTSARCTELPDDLLLRWFLPNAATRLRVLERSIFEFLVDHDSAVLLAEENDLVSELSDLAAFFYTALFHTIRAMLQPFRSSNPTWIRIPPLSRRVRPDWNKISEAFQSAVKHYAELLMPGGNAGSHQTIRVASSGLLPLKSNSADLVVTSPPYCTRIDYAISTFPELAALGFTSESFRTLRVSLIGTPTIAKTVKPSFNWGLTANVFLKRVAAHPSKASSSYYLRCFSRYFHEMQISLEELRRVLSSKGRAILVVQDSYYKDVHNDLPSILSEMATSLGWRVQRHDFPARQTLAAVNPRVRPYRKTFSAIESALVLSPYLTTVSRTSRT